MIMVCSGKPLVCLQLRGEYNPLKDPGLRVIASKPGQDSDRHDAIRVDCEISHPGGTRIRMVQISAPSLSR